jgi:hypothetical protein
MLRTLSAALHTVRPTTAGWRPWCRVHRARNDPETRQARARSAPHAVRWARTVEELARRTGHHAAHAAAHHRLHHHGRHCAD